MKRVAVLFLPEWPIERLRQAERTAAPPDSRVAVDAAPLTAAVIEERLNECSVPREAGFRPGARWARADLAAEIDALPAHQRPRMRELGRRSEAADHPFKAMPPDEGLRPMRAHVAEREMLRDGRMFTQVARGIPPRNGEGDHAQHGGGGSPQAQRLKSVSRHTPAAHLPRKARRSPHAPSTALPAAPLSMSGRNEAPLVTSVREGNRVLVSAACPAARALGIAPGMAVTAARAQVPGLDVRPADPAGDAAALRRLSIRAARRWTPVVAHAGEHALFLDLTGVAHLFGGEARMARRILRLLARRGHRGRIAVADTAGAAWALVQHPEAARQLLKRMAGASPASPRRRKGGSGERREQRGEDILLCPPSNHAEAIAPLPVSALRIAPQSVELLRRLGVDRIGTLAAMPRAPLVRRFGAEIAQRLDQALGHAPEPLDPVVPPQQVAVTQRFAEPVLTAEGIAHWLGKMMPQLAQALGQAGLGARSVEMVAERIDGEAQRIRIGLARPSRDAAHMLRLVARNIERVEPGFGIEAIHLHVRRAERLGATMFDERIDEASTPDLAPLVDTLATRIGEARMWRSAPVESDVPERSVTHAPVLAAPKPNTQRRRADDVRQLARTAVQPRWPRPVRLLRRPEPVDDVLALLPDQPPRRFTWRGQTHKVVRADGPERIHGEWWKRSAELHAARDYFRVEDEAGRRYWLFRHGDGERAVSGDMRWYLHGVFG